MTHELSIVAVVLVVVCPFLGCLLVRFISGSFLTGAGQEGWEHVGGEEGEWGGGGGANCNTTTYKQTNKQELRQTPVPETAYLV